MFDTLRAPARALGRLGRIGLAPLIIGACNPAAPADVLPTGAVPMTAPTVYAEWFEATEACSGLSGSLARVQWLVVPGVETFETDEGPKVGLWVRRGEQHLIVIAGNYQGHEMVVRHEMLHSIIGKHGHPTDLFSDKCRLTWEAWGAD